MESLDYWRLCDDLSVIQAALLIVGEDPSSLQEYVERNHAQNRPMGYEAAKSALKGAVRSKKIVAKIRYPAWERGWNEEPEIGEEIHHEKGSQYIFKNEPDWANTTVSVTSLKQWLFSRGFTTGFFFPNQQHNLPYLDKSHPQYAPKLAIAIMAWEEVTQNTLLLKNKSPKEAIRSWLESNAAKFDLSNQAIEEVAKVANWNSKGGAPSTQANITKITEEIPYEPEAETPHELDETIPF